MIIIVDDNEDILMTLGIIVEDQGHQSRTFTTGEDAWRFLSGNEHPVRMVISDFRLPGMNGIDFLEQVGERYAQAPRMLISGHPPKAVPAGIAVLRKPFQLEDFDQMTRQMIRQTSGQREVLG